MSSWGGVQGRQKKTGQPQSWSAHPPIRGLYPRSRAKRGTGESTGSQTKSNNLPIFYQQFSKAMFSGVGEMPYPPPFPQGYCCHLLSLHISSGSLLSEMRLRYHISPPNPRGYPTLNRGEELCKRLYKRQQAYPHFLDSQLSKTHQI